MANTPNIRFKGFTDDWEQRKISDIAEFSKGQGYSKGDLKEQGTPIILYGRLYTKYETRITDVDTFVDAKPNSVYSKGGEVIIPASGETAEDIARAATVEKPGILLGGDLNVVTPDNEIDSAFLALFISNGNAQKELAKKAQGKSVVHIHNEEIKDLVISLPKHAEQRKIALYFDYIDYLITFHQRKCDETKEIKKYMLQKMFPQNGKKIPEIRFAGFTDAWEQRKLNEIFEERNEQYPMSEDYPLMAFIANVGVAPKGERYDRSALINDEQGKKYKRTELGDFIYSSNNLETGSIGLNNYGNACISPVYSIFKSKNNSNSDFLGRMLLRKEFINAMVQYRQGVVYGQWKIHESDFLNLHIAIPSLDEQKMIGTYFKEIDTLITLHQRKCDELKEVKKFMLKNMFPQKG